MVLFSLVIVIPQGVLQQLTKEVLKVYHKTELEKHMDQTITALQQLVQVQSNAVMEMRKVIAKLESENTQMQKQIVDLMQDILKKDDLSLVTSPTNVLNQNR